MEAVTSGLIGASFRRFLNLSHSLTLHSEHRAAVPGCTGLVACSDETHGIENTQDMFPEEKDITLCLYYCVLNIYKLTELLEIFSLKRVK